MHAHCTSVGCNEEVIAQNKNFVSLRIRNSERERLTRVSSIKSTYNRQLGIMAMPSNKLTDRLIVCARV